MPAIENDEFLKEKENFEKVAAEVNGYIISLKRNIGTNIIISSGLIEKFNEIFDMIREGRQKYTLEELQETTKKLKAAFDEVKPKSEELVKKKEKERKEKKEKEENLEKIKEETISYIESLKIKLKRS